MGPRFFLRTVATTVAMVFGTAAGFWVGYRFHGAGTVAAAVAGALLSLMAAWTFRGEGWTPVLLSGFSAAAGLLVAHLPALKDPPSARMPMVVAFGGVFAGAMVGRCLRRGLQGAYAPIWVGAWLAVLSAVTLQLTGSRTEWVLFAAKVVLALFILLAAAWFARLGTEPPPLAALDLYLIGLNLFLAAAVLLGPAV